MMHARRWKLSAAQRADMWSRWKAGQSLNAIGRALGKDHVVIRFLLARHGGIAPPARRRSRRALTLAEREDISRGIASGCSDRGCCLHLRKTCGSQRSCHSRTLGGRSVARGAQQSRSHSGGASFAFLHAGEGARQRHRYGGGRLEPARAPTPSDVASLANLGPRAGDGRAQKLHHGYGCAGLLLRSTKSLAARIERKHERAIAAISAEEGGPNPLLAVGSGRDRFTAESTAATNVGDVAATVDCLAPGLLGRHIRRSAEN